MVWVLENIKELLLSLIGVIMTLWLYLLKRSYALEKLTEVFMSEINWWLGFFLILPSKLKLKTKVAGSMHKVILANGNDYWGWPSGMLETNRVGSGNLTIKDFASRLNNWQLKAGHGGDIYTTEISKYYKSGLFWAAYHWSWIIDDRSRVIHGGVLFFYAYFGINLKTSIIVH